MRDIQQTKLLLRYVADIVRTVKGEPICVLDAANSLHPNLQFRGNQFSGEFAVPGFERKCISG